MTEALDIIVVSTTALGGESVAALFRTFGYRVRAQMPTCVALAADLVVFVSAVALEQHRSVHSTHDRTVCVVGVPKQQGPGGVDHYLDPRIDVARARALLTSILGAPEHHSATELSAREATIVAGYVKGKTRGELAREYYLADATVSTHLSRAREKYRAHGRQVRSKVDLAYRAIEDGLIECPCTHRRPRPIRSPE
ncbi:response regulator transcription factor [Rhodococcus sp. MALMAid1271]|uniref:helix-turn-helix transcriptional regulator n=1 Tax=Rhodococcus sp. MALMAid1271 TaxID=3411744 RepID=UPI003B9F2A1E